jgi:pullulanase
MAIFHKILLTMVSAATALVACAPKTDIEIPQAPLEECVYSGGKTEFSVWSPKAEAAQLKLYHSAQDTAAFMTRDMKRSKGGLWKVTVKEDLKGEFYTFQVKMDGKLLEETAGIAATAEAVSCDPTAIT